MADQQRPLSLEDRDERARVQRIEREQLAWTNILRLRGRIRDAAKEQEAFDKVITKLQGEQAQEAIRYQGKLNVIKRLEENLIQAKKNGNEQVAKAAKKMLDQQQAKLQDLAKTEGGALAARKAQAESTKKALTAERDLIKDINSQRSITSRVTDLFRSKEAKQRQIDIARARAGGGANIPIGAGGGAGGAGGIGAGGAAGTAGGAGGRGGGGGARGAAGAVGILGGLGIVGAIALAAKAGIDKIKDAASAVGNVLKNNLTAPLAQVSNLVSGGIGGGYGVGGGAISGAGATSILGGFQDIASKIPFIGGLLGGLVGIFKGVVDLVLGLDQGLTNFARNLGISKDRAKVIKEEFREVAKASGNIVINETRLMESQVELAKTLGVRNLLSKEIVQTNVELKEQAGIELETRKAIAQLSVLQNKDAIVLTKNILAQSKALEFETGVAFDFRQTLGEASKQAGVLGLTFAKYPEKLTKSLLTTKAMGFELKQLDGMASSFLDFESSISKEMEAQVLLGRDVNLTKAREAALNNDLVTLAKEITSQVGNSKQFLSLNRIQQEAIAESVGMTRDGLADVLKQQEYYKRLGADNLKSAQAELKALKAQGLTREEISKKIGEDAYNNITNLSVAESLTELMNRIKTIFIEFVEKSGILDFITNPEKIQGFVSGLIERLAGAVNMIGSIIAGILETVADIAGFFSSEREASLKGLASQVRAGSAAFAGGLQGAAANIGGIAAPSISSTVQAGAKVPAPEGYIPGPVAPAAPGEQTTTVYLMIDGEVVAKQVAVKAASLPQFKPLR